MCDAGAGRRTAHKRGEDAMWSAFVRQFAAYALTRRGKKLFAFLGAMLLVFATTFLVDLQLYASAGFTGALALFATGAYGVQHVKLKRRHRERQLRLAEDAIRRAERAKARAEKIGQTKAAFTGALSGAFGNAAQAVSDAVTGTAKFFADAFTEMAQEVSDAYDETTQTIGNAATGTARAVSNGASGLMQSGRDALAKAFSFVRRASEAPHAPAMVTERRLAGPHAIPQIGLRPDLN
jgi:hypothetical protein